MGLGCMRTTPEGVGGGVVNALTVLFKIGGPPPAHGPHRVGHDLTVRYAARA